MKPPAPRPCGSCPYRRDIPSGVWEAEEYEKLPGYDLPTAEQPPSVFLCHQQDGRLCAGWVGCHDMDENLGLRFAAITGKLTEEEIDQVLDYQTDVALFESGAAAHAHGIAEVEEPGEKARQIARKLSKKLG